MNTDRSERSVKGGFHQDKFSLFLCLSSEQTAASISPFLSSSYGPLASSSTRVSEGVSGRETKSHSGRVEDSISLSVFRSYSGVSAVCGILYLAARLQYFNGYSQSAQQR